MHVARIGFTPLKGGRHREHPSVDLAATGPVGDRGLCLVDPVAARCLRTVENPALVRLVARRDGERLTLDLPGRRVEGDLHAAGETLTVDYWGRDATVEILDGPFGDACSEHLGRHVVLARARPGDVVYGGSVTLVTTGSLALLSERVGAPVAGERFRATLHVDTGDLPAHVEDGWVGRELTLGTARLRVRGIVPRCAVVDLDPETGERDRDVMKALAGYRRGQGEVFFGVDAEVTEPGRVLTGDEIELGRD
ncbi:MAG: MOSC domain-containing protein [Nocardioidaceae bacterium]